MAKLDNSSMWLFMGYFEKKSSFKKKMSVKHLMRDPVSFGEFINFEFKTKLAF